MSASRATIAVSLMLLSQPALADFFNGAKLYSLLESGDPNNLNTATGYIMGVHDALMNVASYTEPRIAESFKSCIPEGVNSTQFRAVVKKYLDDNPARLHFSASILIGAALSEAFSCDQ